MLPNLCIIGAQKAGSTYLQHLLDQHPKIAMEAGEVPFFESPDYEKGSLKSLERDFTGAGVSYYGIKRPSYLTTHEVPARLQKDLPDVKLIALLRNPIERAISAYYHNMRYGFLPLLNPNIGIRRILNESEFRKKYPVAEQIISFGFYAEALAAYEKFLNSRRLHLILSEDIWKTTQSEMNKVYTFLNLNSTIHSFPRNSMNNGVYDIAKLRFLRMLNPIFYTYSEDLKRIYVKKVNPGQYFIGAVAIRLQNFWSRYRSGSRIPSAIDFETWNLLAGVYVDDVSRLQSFLAKNLSHWLDYSSYRSNEDPNCS